MLHSHINSGMWLDERGVNLLDTGAPFYEVYETKDAEYVAVGAIEPQFYAALLRGLDIGEEELPSQHDRDQSPSMKQRFQAKFLTRTRDEWTALFEDIDACVTPVLSPREATQHRYNTERAVFVDDERPQPAPAPRFSRTPGAVGTPPSTAGSGTREGLAAWGVSKERIDDLLATGAFHQ
jgi:alpha-methylacyl-CoA racemase